MRCWKSLSLEEKQEVAQRMLREAHMCKDLLVGTVTKNNCNSEKCLGKEIKTKGKRRKVETLRRRDARSPQKTSLPLDSSTV